MSSAEHPSGQKERELFIQAMDKPTRTERAAYLDGVCGNDTALRRRLELLLERCEQLGTFLENPVVSPSNPDRDPLSAAEAPAPATVLGSTMEQTGTVIGRYKLLEKIGEGGFGTVYVADQREPVKRRVALKIIKLGLDTRQVVSRFEAERQALALMDHPNIAKVFDAGATETGRPYFVMELVRGIPITQYCDENHLCTNDRLKLFMLVCEAIQHAHQKGIIHRDIKPSNVLLTVNDGVAVPKVIDFGIAKATQGQLTDKTIYTQFQQFIGTPAYVSPEQADMTSVDIDTRSDIYALGVLLYELLVGQTPFDAKELLLSGLDEMRRTIREKEPIRPSTRLANLVGKERTTVSKHHGAEMAKLTAVLRGDVDWIVMKCLEKDRARRYATANGLAADINRFLREEPIVARPPSRFYRLQKFARRNKLAFLAVTSIAAALVLGTVVSTWQAFRAIEASLAEKEQHLRADIEAQKASESEQQSRRLLYAADMNLARQSLKLNNLGRARRLLDRHRPPPGEEDLRGWEWRYLWQLTRSSALVTLTNRPVRGWSVSFSPDGAHLGVGWEDGQVDLWDVPGRRLVSALVKPETAYLNYAQVAFSPNRNLLAFTSEPEVVTLYDLDSGIKSPLWRAPGLGPWSIRDLAFSQDGSRVVIYAGSTPELGDAVWVVNMSASTFQRYPSVFSGHDFHGAARLSPDNRRLYLACSGGLDLGYSIQCLDLATSKELWRTEPQPDQLVTTLDISPDGQLLACGSGFADPTIRVWDAETGRTIRELDRHTGWVSQLTFTKSGGRLISASSDQSIRSWNARNWSEIQVLRGHIDEVQAVTISETAHLVAGTGKDGKLILWSDDGKGAIDGYRHLPEIVQVDGILLLDHSRLLLLPPGKLTEWIDLKRDSPPAPLPELGFSTNVLGCFGNLLGRWNGTNQVLFHELRGADFFACGAITVDSGVRPPGFSYNPKRRLLAWAEGTNSASVFLAGLAVPGSRIELKSDVAGVFPSSFSEDGNHLVAGTARRDCLRVWDVESRQIVISINKCVNSDAIFASSGRVLVVITTKGKNQDEIRFYDLAHPDQSPRRVLVRSEHEHWAVLPDGALVALSSLDGQVRLFDPVKGTLLDSLHGHLNGVFGIAFSPDGRRLISGSGGREAVKLWDVGTRQELLTLSGTGSALGEVRWSADGDMILAGSPWQVWRAPSWEEIAAAEAKENRGSSSR